MFSILSSEENAKTKKKKKEKDKAYEAFLAKRSRGMKPLKMPVLYFTEERFQNTAKMDLAQPKFINWRMKERMKTVSVALVLCLNIGVDPPDIVKPTPCARLESWMDPFSVPPQRALHSIGVCLQMQYERWHHKARYKQCLDPTVEEVKKLCQSLRRNAKDERILFHYNGHGVPRPTSNGELWVFNKNFTQYIPLSIYELQTWMCSPSIYVFDCSAAGVIVNWFQTFAQQREREYERYVATNSPNAGGVVLMKDCILLAACGANEVLPMNPELPADVFTSCLTTPIKMALRWFCSHSMLKGITPEMIDKIPGRLADRRTPLGELNWIFTAVTDTIAWNVLPVELFQKLFRQDLLVASLFRNFLLAERIMRSVNCTPISCPKLPPTYQHPMWQAWDLAADLCLSQLPELLENPPAEFKHTTFFTEQLTAFEIWLDFAHDKKKAPEQLPIVLQVLLSQTHRLRALLLLGRFLDLGSWAVNQALSVGIFPYVLKLLQSPAPDLRQVLVFIWAKILALDKSCQIDLVRENGHAYFISALALDNIPADQRTMAAFVLTVIMNNCRAGQSACLNANILPICLSLLNDPNALLRRWVTFCLAKFWEGFEEAKWCAIRESAHERLCSLLTDPVPEVRATAVYALSTFIGGGEGSEQRTNIELNLGLTLPVALTDSSPIVRKELIVAISRLIATYDAQFKDVAYEVLQEEAKEIALMEMRKEEERKKSGKKDIKNSPGSNSTSPINSTSSTPNLLSIPQQQTPSSASSSLSPPSPGLASVGPQSSPSNTGAYVSRQQSSVYGLLWKMLISLTTDPYPELASLAISLVSKVTKQITGPNNTVNRPSSNTSSNVRFLPSLKRSSGSVKNSLRTSSNAVASSPRVGEQSQSLIDGQQSSASVGTTSANSTPLASSTILEDTDQNSTLMIPSTLYEWSCTYFSRPMNSNEELDVTTPLYIERCWRKERNKIAKKEALELKTPLVRKFDEQIGIIDNESDSASLLLMHPFDPMLVVADDKDGIKIWNWEEGNKINAFKNTNAPGTRISAVSFLNEMDITMLLVGSDDGVVRIWRNFWKSDSQQLVTAWRALSELPPGRARGNGMVIDWQQQNGLMMTSGDVPFIRVWDMAREQSIQDIPTGTDACITSLTNDKSGGKTLVAGCGDGSIRIYDCRVPPRFSLSNTFHEHESWLVKVEVPKSEFKIISGAAQGDIKFWDPRGTGPSLNTIPGTSGLSAMAVHDYAPCLASGSQTQKIKIHNFNGDEITMIRYHDGFLGQRIGPVASLCFHPYKPILGAGAADSIISIYESTP